ncbi:MAG: hypothetical protein UX73_C0008G0005 [candidate division WWE3 bacterium GW2011_GWC1_47_10]|uniref:Uncharacterized protein n=1 Tax=candidate division WWE3 bacterium GW2011_GWC1_47_10 TaxID=1619122 RepID=A0A0G1R1M5_UNCKA|nr:MAG: hypothetical protein UX73_C0008G0005 [candidate division WWE3 bacterium GW2011_GWC1_47_10]
MILLTVCFSIYSLMSNLTSISSWPYKTSASALDSSVLPTPVGPRNKKVPMGLFGSFKPARARLMASETICTALSWLTILSCIRASMCNKRSFSSMLNSSSGMPVALATIFATSFLVTFGISSNLVLVQISTNSFLTSSIFASSRSSSAFSCSCSALRSLFLSSSRFSSTCRRFAGSFTCVSLTWADASSITSMALSGKNLSLMYLSDI